MCCDLLPLTIAVEAATTMATLCVSHCFCSFLPSLLFKSPHPAQDVLLQYRPRASLLPAVLDLTDCPYMWPHCITPVYASRLPLLLNTTILNGMGLIGALQLQWLFTGG